MKVRELAKKWNLSIKALITILRDLGYDIKSSAYEVDPEIVQKFEDYMQKKKEEYLKTIEFKKKIWAEPQEEKRERFPKPQRFPPKLPEKRVKEPIKVPIKRKPKKFKKEELERKPSEYVEEKRTIIVPSPITTNELAKMLGVPVTKVIEEAFKIGIIATINQTLDISNIKRIAELFGTEVKTEELKEEPEITREKIKETQKEEKRPPIVTVMGHVDHGKTTLLDYIRNTRIAEKEYGQITQHIGASKVEYKGHYITFIDTPGHEAFTTLRARGAKVTDIVVLVVSAVEGVKPQTVEAINHARAFNVPIIVAINKMDLPQRDPDKVRRQLSELGLIPEEWGGDTIFVEISAKTGMGVDELFEAILVKAEELDLKTSYNVPARGVVIESKLEKGRGPVGTVLIQEGTLKVGDEFVCGITYGKVRAIYDAFQKHLPLLKPSEPGVVQGFEELPRAGDELIVVEEGRAKELAEERRELLMDQIYRGDRLSLLERIKEKLQKGEKTKVYLIIKADTQGSLEAVSNSVLRISQEPVEIEILHGGIGNVTESDVMLASAANALILGFNVGVDPKAKELSKQEMVDIKTYKLIYELINDMENLVKAKIGPKYVEEIIGSAEVRQVFKITGVGNVAGSYVLKGSVRRDAKVRVKRDSEIIFDGKVASLRRFKEDVKEVPMGYECGIRIDGFGDFQVGDILEFYVLKEV